MKELDRFFAKITDSTSLVSSEDLAIVIPIARRVDDRDLQYVDRIFPGLARFMRPWELEACIKDEISDKEVAKIVSEQKKYFLRLRTLLPAILMLFSPRPSSAINLISCIDDCIHDLPYFKKSPRSDKKFREREARLKSAHQTASDLLSIIGSLKEDLISYPELYKRAYFEEVLAQSEAASGSIDLELKYFKENIDLSILLHRSMRLTESDLSETVKGHVVEQAYYMTLAWRGPRFITTPGSGFAHLCALLFELGGGPADESFAGAINKYSKSSSRRKADENELRLQSDEKEFEKESQDNFYAVKEQLQTKLRRLPNIKIYRKVVMDSPEKPYFYRS